MSRNEEFANAARSQTASTYDPPKVYRQTSVNDPIMPAGNGFGSTERSRLLPGNQMLPSTNGVSTDSYQRRLWLR